MEMDATVGLGGDWATGGLLTPPIASPIAVISWSISVAVVAKDGSRATCCRFVDGGVGVLAL